MWVSGLAQLGYQPFVIREMRDFALRCTKTYTRPYLGGSYCRCSTDSYCELIAFVAMYREDRSTAY